MSANNDAQIVRTVGLVIGALVVFMILIIIAANVIFDSSGLSHKSPEAMAEEAWKNIAPVGTVTVAGSAAAMAAAPEAAPLEVNLASAGASTEAATGMDIYKTACFACHGTGAAGAPKLGDSAAWSARIAQGEDILLDHALKGFKGMPPKGGRMDMSDDDIAAAVDYMVSESQ